MNNNTKQIRIILETTCPITYKTPTVGQLFTSNDNLSWLIVNSAEVKKTHKPLWSRDYTTSYFIWKNDSYELICPRYGTVRCRVKPIKSKRYIASKVLSLKSNASDQERERDSISWAENIINKLHSRMENHLLQQQQFKQWLANLCDNKTQKYEFNLRLINVLSGKFPYGQWEIWIKNLKSSHSNLWIIIPPIYI